MANNEICKMIRPVLRWGLSRMLRVSRLKTIKRELGLKKSHQARFEWEPAWSVKEKHLPRWRRRCATCFTIPTQTLSKWSRRSAKKVQGKTRKYYGRRRFGWNYRAFWASFSFCPEDEVIISDHAFIRYQMSGKLMNSKSYKHSDEKL